MTGDKETDKNILILMLYRSLDEKLQAFYKEDVEHFVGKIA